MDDEVRLGRLVPYAVALLSDSSSIVRSTAVEILTRILSLVNSISQSDGHIFTEYLFPSLSRFPADPEELVRLSYATHIAQLAETSKKFLDMSQYMKQIAARNLTSAGAGNTAAHDTAGGTATNDDEGNYEMELGVLQDGVLKLVTWTSLKSTLRALLP